MNKLYNKIVFHNTTSPDLNEDNLNEMSEALDGVDSRIVQLAGDVIEKVHDIMELSENPPYIGANGNWYVWDTETGAYVDSGVDASISVDIADVTMLPVGATPYVTNTGTATDPIFHLFIPMGNDGDYSNLSNRPKINGTTLSGSGQGNTYALTDISMIAKYMPSTNIVPTGQTYEKGAIVWIKGLHGQYLRRMNEDAAAGSNWVNKSSAVTLNDLINALYANVENEVITRASLGAHNLLPNNIASGTYNSGTVTKNTDGSLTINGAFSAVTTINMDYKTGLSDAVFDVLPFVGKNLVASILDTAVTGITLQVGYFSFGGTRTSIDAISTKSNIVFPSGAVKSATYLRIASGTYNNVTIYPMIRLASDSDSTYQPYAKTNKQLTDNVKDIETAIAPIEIGTASQAYAKGDYLIMNDKLYKVTQAIASGATLIVGTNIAQTSVAEELKVNDLSSSVTWDMQATTKAIIVKKTGKVVSFYGYINPSSNVTSLYQSILHGLPKASVITYVGDVKRAVAFSVENQSADAKIINQNSLSAGTQYTFSGTYICE